jgi:hypothetical protein
MAVGTTTPAESKGMSPGREVLLHGEKRNAVLDLPEIQRYGIDNYGDANFLEDLRHLPLKVADPFRHHDSELAQ